MSRLSYLVAIGVFAATMWGHFSARGQLGNPTAPPPGGANSAGTAGAAGTAQPAGRAGTASPAGGAFSAGRAGTAGTATRLGPMNRNVDPSLTGRTSPLLNDPSVAPRGFDPSTSRTYFGDGTSAQQSFGNTAGMFDRGTAGGGSTGRAPGSALPGRANFSGGSTSAALVPAGPVVGGPNPAQRGSAFPLSPFGGNIPLSAEAESNLRAAVGALMTPVAPIGPAPVEQQSAPAGSIPTVEPNDAAEGSGQIVPAIPFSAEIPSAQRATSPANARVAPREAPAENVPVATATAYPDQKNTTRAATTPPARPPVTGSAATQFTEVPSGGGAPQATDNNTRPVIQNNLPAQAGVPYRVWQGYYWFNVPRTGWHYWDGARWVRFSDLE